LERAELRVDRGVVRDVVAEVGQRRGVERREPERVDAEPDEVVEALHDPAEVADTISVGVLERPGVDLVDDRLLPAGHGRRGYVRRAGPEPFPGPGPGERRSD